MKLPLSGGPCEPAYRQRVPTWEASARNAHQFGLVPLCRVRSRTFSTNLWICHRSAGISSNRALRRSPSQRTRAPRCSPVRLRAYHRHPRVARTREGSPDPQRVHRLSGATQRDTDPKRIHRTLRRPLGTIRCPVCQEAPASENELTTQLARQAMPQVRASARCLAPTVVTLAVDPIDLVVFLAC
jgi:hypothetical protein